MPVRPAPVRPSYGKVVRVGSVLTGAAALLAVLAPGAGAAVSSRQHAQVSRPVTPLAQVAASARADDDPGNPMGLPPAGASTPSVTPALTPAATSVPPTPTGLPAAIEAWPVPYEAQTSCDPAAKPGVTAWMNTLTATYGAQNDGISRTCYIGSTSEHEEGRALDWGIDARNPTEYAQGMAVVSWLLAKDAAGNPAAMARRLGIMYVIFNSRILGLWDTTPTWEPYSCSGVTACHIDHMHFSFTWDGALGRTSYWSKSAVTRTDYGPCRLTGLAWAPQRVVSNYNGCPRVSGPTTPKGAPSWYANAASWSGVTLRSGSSGAAVSALQPALRVPVTGTMDSRTVAAVAALQRAKGLPASGVVDATTWRAVLGTAVAPKHAVPGDFTGDGMADPAVFRPSTGQWLVQGRSPVVYGQSGDVPVSGDYDGDGRADLAVFRPSTGQWFVQGKSPVVYGQSGDVPVPADYNGDGRTDLAVFRPSTGQWFVQGRSPVVYGQSGDVPVPADYTGDGRTDLAIFRPSTGTWYVIGGAGVVYGQQGDVAVPGNYFGDGRAHLAVFRPSTGTWYVIGRPGSVYGQDGDVPLVTDWTGSGHDSYAVYRPGTGTWYVIGRAGVVLGQPDDIPVTGARPTA